MKQGAIASVMMLAVMGVGAQPAAAEEVPEEAFRAAQRIAARTHTAADLDLVKDIPNLLPGFQILAQTTKVKSPGRQSSCHRPRWSVEAERATTGARTSVWSGNGR